ncbi:MAG: ribonuclease H-like domain-containing protein [Armatimonadota bacterium]
MLERTFIHLPKVGPVTERRLWRDGIRCWQDFLQAGRIAGISPERADLLKSHLGESCRCLADGDAAYFARRLPPPEHWRGYPNFRRRTAFLDIETTGLGPPHRVTVVGVYDGLRTRTYVAGDNLDQFPEDMAQYTLLVTYNGATFDLPFLRWQFPGLRFDQMHVDLRYALARLGLRGGLKSIEERLGLERNERIAGLNGFDAVRLWREYEAGSDESLDLLVEYNTADIQNLERLMELAYQGLAAQLEAD